MASPTRPYDIVLLGATGFAGRLTAAHLATRMPPEAHWAIAGRNRARLEAVRDDLLATTPGAVVPGIEVADVEDQASLVELARSTRVLVTTVGPYVHHGDGVVAACARAGTDYLDLTGEPEFVDNSYVRHHATAVATGARLVHSAGFDSVPHDLGAMFTADQLPDDVPIRMAGYVRVSARPSGGTLASLLAALSRPAQNLRAARARAAAEPRTSERHARASSGRPHRDPTQPGWAVPLPTGDPQVIVRSARALSRFGPDFRYTHFASFPHVGTAAGAVGGVAGLAVAAQLPPVRAALSRRLAPGDGPSAAVRGRSWFTVTFVGEGGGRRVVTRVSGGDPGYDETSRMLGESALALAFDDLPDTRGQVTTATAMGDALLARLTETGLRFETLA